MASPNPSYSYELVRELAKYLLREIPEIKRALPEFPKPNDILEKPSIVVRTGANPLLEPHQKTQVGFTGALTAENQRNVLYSIGNINAQISIDIFSGYSEERASIIESIIRAFNKSLIEDDLNRGLKLRLQNYYNAIADYLVSGYNIIDSGQEAQSSEYRATMRVEARVPELVEGERFIVTQKPQLTSEIEEI